MAFVKKSVTQPTKVTVGKQLTKCASCGIPFVSNTKTDLCKNCIPYTADVIECNFKDGVSEKCPKPNIDTDQD